MNSCARSILATLVAVGASASGLLHAADQIYPTALGATDDAVIAGGAPTAVTAAQVKIGGGQLATGGNVGIGGLSGGDRLDVFGTTRLRGNTAVTVPAAADGSVSLTVTGTGTIGMGFNATAAANPYGAPAGALYLGGTNGQNLSLTTMGVERMRLDTGGRVGIGTAPVAAIGRLQLPQGTTRDQGLALGADVSLYRYNTGSLAIDTGGGDVTMALQRGAARTYLAATAGGGYLVTDSSVPLTFRTANADRMVIDGMGNVGIGSIPVGGQGQLQIQPGSGNVMVRLNGGKTASGDGSAIVCGQGGGYNQAFGNWSAVIGGAYDNTGVLFSVTGWKFTTGGTSVRMLIDSAGNVGIGTASPSNALHLVSSTNAGGRFDIASANGATGAANLILANANTTSGNASGIEFVNGGGGPTAFISAINYNHNINGSTTGGLDFAVYNAGTLSHALVIAPSGNIGIGVPAPTSALAVNGLISAKEIKVVANPADYVFANGYHLRPLAEVEAFIAAHKHLPGVPSAKEQEEQGEMVADLMRAHLEKIEELNLYVIQQQKVIEDLVAQQKARDKSFAEVLARLALLEGKGGVVK